MSSLSPDGHGLWHGDTRILSEYHLLIDGAEPRAVDLRAGRGEEVFELESGPFRIGRERFVARGMHERITITNAGPAPASAHVELKFDSDFAAMLAVRGIVPRTGHPSGNPPRILVTPEGRRWHVELAPQERWQGEVHVVPHGDDLVPGFDAGVERLRHSYRSWADDCASIVTDNPRLNELIEQSRDDMRMLCDVYPTGIYPTGGLPWFAVPFGRDALFTSMFGLPLNPDIARGALRFLAAHQGQTENPDTEEQPGKILHEVRTGEVVDQGIWPHILYGTVDATPLYLVALAEAHDWTGDDELLDELWPAAEKALAWCEQFGDTDGDGWIDYHGARARNQGWKDSDDSLTHVDGRPAPTPAALCEVQAYFYRGLLGMSSRRPELKARAEELRRKFGRDFWMNDENFIAQSLDGAHSQVRAISSNPGHCLWGGILDSERARMVSRRLLEPDMWSGWGVRTLSDLAVNYDPCSYHNGSVWPHDCTLAAAGMRRAGRTRDAEKVARAVLEAGMAFPDRRLPELWCGTERAEGELPDDYRSSCSPQNWAAASVFALLTTLLGLDADAKRKRLSVAPVTTPLFSRVEVKGLHFAGRRVDFTVDGETVHVDSAPDGVNIVTGEAIKG